MVDILIPTAACSVSGAIGWAAAWLYNYKTNRTLRTLLLAAHAENETQSRTIKAFRTSLHEANRRYDASLHGRPCRNPKTGRFYSAKPTDD